MSQHHHQPPSAMALRVAALEQLLTDKGYCDPDTIDRLVELYETRVGPHHGARVVAEAWSDAAFRERLLTNASRAMAGLGISGMQGENMVVVENTPDVHNVVVCTLCSCYPWPVLGLPPRWYKSEPYRARVVREPRIVLAEMGCDVTDDVEIRVWDSSADLRYMVLPRRPADSDEMSREELAGLVTRDGMIGVALV
ncbi:MAG: nitrile hydratase subunit alpha [Alphaproteobacteria bacterium]|nr:nitrile hydratase subunit alpha [Alphaproteobacteria bacterium]